MAGPIPRSKIKEYGREELGLSDDALDSFISMISLIDGEYLSLSSTPHPAEQQQKDGKPKLKKRERVNPLSAKRKDR